MTLFQVKILLFVLGVGQILRQGLDLSEQTLDTVIDRLDFFLPEVVFPF